MKIHKIPEVQIPERIQRQTVLGRIEELVGDILAPPVVDDTVEILVTERIQDHIGPEQTREQLIAEESTQNPMEIPITSFMSTSSCCRLDEFANMLDLCMALLTPMTAQIENIEKETERAAMLTKRMMETPLREPPMMEPLMMEPPARGRLRDAPGGEDGVRDGNMGWRLASPYPFLGAAGYMSSHGWQPDVLHAHMYIR